MKSCFSPLENISLQPLYLHLLWSLEKCKQILVSIMPVSCNGNIKKKTHSEITQPTGHSVHFLLLCVPF
jgi:hypothetical protein